MTRAVASARGTFWAMHSFLRYDVLGRQKKRLDAMFEELGAEAHFVRQKLLLPFKKTMDKALPGNNVEQIRKGEEVRKKLTRLSCPEDGACLVGSEWRWISPRSQEDRTIPVPMCGRIIARTFGCPIFW